MPKQIITIEDPAIIEELNTFPNQGVIWGILSKTNKGQAWELPGKKAFLLMEENCADPFVFIAGSLDSKAVDAAISLCPAERPMIYCNPIYHHLFLEKGWDFWLRIQFSYTKPMIPRMNENWIIQPIDNIKLFQKCLSFEQISKCYGSPENFLKNGKGYVLCQEDKIVSEALTDYYGRGYAEMGVITHPDYRGQGAATQVASYLAEVCKAQQDIPIWSCQVDNRASLYTALKIGFRIERYYVQMVPEVGNTFGPSLEAWMKNQSHL